MVSKHTTLTSTFTKLVQNYSPILVDHSASDATIKKAYRKLSRKYHPDKNKDPEAEQKFVDVSRGVFGLLMGSHIAFDNLGIISVRGFVGSRGIVLYALVGKEESYTLRWLETSSV